MVDKVNVLNIDTDCTDNGIGIRTTVYLSGCTHYCKGCHNPKSWNKNAGQEMTIYDILEKILENPLADVTITGGDPLTFQYEGALQLVQLIKEKTNKTIWLYTGYEIEEIPENKQEILKYIDCLVDGRFCEDKKDLELQFRGSSNQRIIDVQKTLQSNSIQLWNY